MTQGRRRSLEGVGIGYHPFLHRTILSRPVRFDFVELPLESYLDEAQRALLDPDLARAGAIAEALPCFWRGSALSLGSAAPSDTVGTQATIERLVARTNAILLREDLAFRRAAGRDLGLAQPPPVTDDMADLAGRRCETLVGRLPCRFAIGLSLDALAAAGADVAAAFLRRLAAATSQDLALDLGAGAVAAGPEVLAAILAGIPAGRVVQIALTVTEAPVWPLLDAMLAVTGARSILIRRFRNLFPFEDIIAAVEQAREALARAGAQPVPDLAAATTVDRFASTGPDLAATRRDQAAFAERCGATTDDETVSGAVAAVRARAVWRERIADLHRTKQLARWAESPATWRV